MRMSRGSRNQETYTRDDTANADSPEDVSRSVGQWGNKTGVTTPERSIAVTVT